MARSPVFVMDIKAEGQKKKLVVLNKELQLQEFTLANEYNSYVLMFSSARFKTMLRGCGIPHTLRQESQLFRSCNKNILQCLFDDDEVNKQGTLMCITTQTYGDFCKIERLLYNNRFHVNVYAYNPQGSSLLFGEAMRFSLAANRDFKFRQLSSTWVNLKMDDRNDCWRIASIAENQYNALDLLPRVSFDLETLGLDEAAFPLGIYDGEKISSCSIVVEFKSKRYFYIFLLAPWGGFDREQTLSYLRTKLGTEFVCLLTYPTELELVKNLFVFFYQGMYLTPFGVDTLTTSVITGYNIVNFDLPYLYKRLHFHGFSAMAEKLSVKFGWRKNILLDMFIIEKRHFSLALGNNFKLSNVARIFINDNKLDIQITAVRRLYQDGLQIDVNSTDETIVVNGIHTPSINYTCWYNSVDSILVLDLIVKQGIMSLMYVLSRELNKHPWSVLAEGNSKTLASRINIFMLGCGFFFSSGPPSVIIPRIRALQSTKDPEEYCKILRRIDRDEVVDMISLVRNENPYDDEMMFDADWDSVALGGKGGFGGGANFAKPGCYVGLASMDFTSLYASIKLWAQIDFNNVSVVCAGTLVKFAPRFLQVLVRCCDIFVYEHEEIGDFMKKIGQSADLMTYIKSHTEIEKLPADTKLMIVLPNKDGVLGSLVRFMLDGRNKYKRMFAENPKDVLAKTNEMALKQATCAIFGCMGYEHFEAYSPCSAAAITALARQLITRAAHHLAVREYETIYIDTDGLIVKFVGDDEKLVRLSDEITRAIDAPNIHLKPEAVYRVGVVASKKKYILEMPDGSVKINGFLKNSIAPVKAVTQRWFKHIISKVPRDATFREFSWKVSEEDVYIAFCSELEKLWKEDCAKVVDGDLLNGTLQHLKRWEHLVKINKQSPVFHISEFSKEMRDNYNILEDGTRVPVYKVLDERGMPHMLYANGAVAAHKCRCDAQSVLLEIIAYVLRFTMCPKAPNLNMEDAWARFMLGERIAFESVRITVDPHF